MALESGRRLGAFELLQPIGAGGMGEVYRARDTRLDRTVALKVLPAELSEHPHLRERLEREARAVSSLAHPHICTLHDVGRDDGIDYLVMEYLEGETLADRLQKGPLPLEQALRYAIEIAEALDAAHRQGVVHRDLKAGNIMLTRSGAKLLDFGLAKLREGDPPDPATSASALPTEHRPLTEMGTILGTYPYMAPEQLEGKDVDGRADLFAFGALLHEMVTGRRAFDGESRASLIAAIMEREPPPVSTLQPLSPAGLDHVVTTCLAKDPDDRWHSAHDVASALRWIKEAGSQAGLPAPLLRRKRTRERLVWALSAAVLAFAAAGVGWAWRDASEERSRLVRSSILPPEGVRFDLWRSGLALSPDGASLVFTGRSEDNTRVLWVQSLDRLAARPLEGTEAARHPFWSPDGRSIAFFSEGELRRISVSGGPPQTICEAPEAHGGAWGADGTILFAPGGALHKVSASGGTPVPVTVLDESRNERVHGFPQLLPDGEHFIFVVGYGMGTPGTDEGGAVFAGSLGSMEKTLIVATHSAARFDASGHLLFVRAGTLVAQPFDPDTLELSGDVVPVAENMRRVRAMWGFSLSETGLLVLQADDDLEYSRLVWFDRSGAELGTVGRPAPYCHMPVPSHDRERVAVCIVDPEAGGDIWTIDVERGATTRLTSHPTNDYRPLWSPDDRTVYFTSNRLGNGDIHSKSSSGTGPAELVYRGDGDMDVLWSISSDGATGWLSARSSGPANTRHDILRIDLESLEAEVVLQTPFDEDAPDISPEGRWLLYHSDESGRREVYVRELGDGRGRWPISIDGGAHGRWTRDGREIVFQAPDGTLMAVEVTLEPSFSAGIPEALFDSGFSGWPRWSVTPDGDRFLVNRPIERSAAAALTLVQNWTSALER
jgi:serine/threonine protein kinase